MSTADAAKIMVIDDSQTIRRTAETLLSKEGFTVVTAQDGFEALAKIADHHPDLIFVDIMMPRLDGYQACALISSSRVNGLVRYSSEPTMRPRARSNSPSLDDNMITGVEA